MSVEQRLRVAKAYTSTKLNGAVKIRFSHKENKTMSVETVPQFFKSHCEAFADRPALSFKEDKNSDWITLTYAQYDKKVHDVAIKLIQLGLQQCDAVGILAHNCPEWFLTKFATIRAGGIAFGIYPTSSAKAIHHMLDVTRATICIVGDDEQMEKVRQVHGSLPKLKVVVQLSGPFTGEMGDVTGYYRWCDLMAIKYGNEKSVKEELERRESAVCANECAMLIFTSGTVGMPKAVMISHDNIIRSTETTANEFRSSLEKFGRVVSYLPLSHIAGVLFDMFLSMQIGACVYFADQNALKETLGPLLLFVKPTAFLGVPRVYEKIKEQLTARGLSLDVLPKTDIDGCVDKMSQARLQEKNSSSAKKVQHVLGFDECKIFFCGGAPLIDDVKRFFLNFDMLLLNIYGLSEATGIATACTEATKFNSCGKPVSGVELKIDKPQGPLKEGEICLRGRQVFMGYLENPVQTAEAIDESGWLHTGDWGYIDESGHLINTGRIKELIVTAGGENIPFLLIEQAIKEELPVISNAMVVGDKRKYLTVLLTLKTEVDEYSGKATNKLQADVVKWLIDLGLSHTLLSEVLNTSPSGVNDQLKPRPHPTIVAAIEEGLRRANQQALSHAQKVQKFALLPSDFTIATGELGPTLKLRRGVILEKYASIIEDMYK